MFSRSQRLNGFKPSAARTLFTFKEKQLFRPISPEIGRPEYSETSEPFDCYDEDPRVYTGDDISKARDAGRLARKMLDYSLELASEPNKYTTNDIDRLVHDEIVKHGAYPSPQNYRGFPKSICTSVNDVICHGIPDDRQIEEGDIVSIDVSLYFNGFHGDNCGTIISGDKGSDLKGTKLLNAALEALDKSVEICKPGECISKIGQVVHDVGEKRGFRTIYEFCGHGEYLRCFSVLFFFHWCYSSFIFLV